MLCLQRPQCCVCTCFRLCDGIQKREKGGLMWPCISIPSAHSAKPPPLLWDHPLASRCSWMLNMPSCHLVSPLPGSCPPFAFVQTQIPVTFLSWHVCYGFFEGQTMSWRGMRGSFFFPGRPLGVSIAPESCGVQTITPCQRTQEETNMKMKARHPCIIIHYPNMNILAVSWDLF